MTRACLLVHDFLAASARRAPADIAIECDGQRIAYGVLAERSHELAHALVALGVARGDRVIVLAESSIASAIAFWAVLEAGAVISIVHPQVKPAKLAALVASCQPRVLVAGARLEATFSDVARAAPSIAHVIALGASDAEARARGWLAWDAALALGAGASGPPRRCLDVDLAAIIYTSGSTGAPKGVMLTHRNMVAATHSICECLAMRRDDTILSVLPLAFNYGLYQMIMAVAVGARLFLERSFAFPNEIVQRIAAERVTGFPGVPTIFATLLGLDLARHDLSSLRYLTNTAAALPVKHLLRLHELLPQARIYSMYGLTECKRCTYLPPEDITRKPASVGIAIPNTELWLVDRDDRRLDTGEIGELVIRGSTVMAGYWGEPEETARKLRPGPLPGERVLYTGDLCRLDDEGYLYFVSRMDDIIKSRGEKVPPAEVEAAIMQITGIREVAVIGVPDELLGEAVCAYVLLDGSAALDARAIKRECQARLESYMVPAVIVVSDELPRMANGKIDKTQLARNHT
ncbi:MAG TPA: AMP-binding protein [Kofleriaceae bacterium]|nr:AMP-binding protein [Kofleriaceae bacterium]